MAFSHDLGGIEYFEMNAFPKEKEDIIRLVGERTRRLRVAWSDRGDFVDKISTPPWNTYPYDDSGATVWKTAVIPFPNVEMGQGSAASGPKEDLANYAWALVTVEYTTAIFSYGGNILSETLSPYTEYYPHEYRHLQWAADAEPLTPGERPKMVESGLHYKLKYYNAISIPAVALTANSCVNKVAYTMKTIGLTFGAEMLLYRGMRLAKGVYIDGVSPLQPEYNFSFVYRNGHGWQGHWRQPKAVGAIGVAGWDTLEAHDGVAVKLQPTADFSVF